MATKIRKLDRLLVANRGEIAIRLLRAASELRLNTVAIYTFEDRYSLHRYKADEAYQVGKNNDPLKPYLNIQEIVSLAKEKQIDAIHPGYGFLSENVEFAQACEEAGIIFIGPRPEVMEALGHKTAAKKIAREIGIPLIEDSKTDLTSAEVAVKEANRIGYPVIIKAAAGGGGRGMRVVKNQSELEQAFEPARNEALNAFGNGTLFLEKFIDDPKHLEVQILGDNYGNIVHLYERDCSVQRRFQKVVEIAPSHGLKESTREKLHEYALKIARHVKYNNAGTVEFLLDKDENIYFIEVNPRIQVEHTVTEEVTGVDIVRSQILIASGLALSDTPINIKSQEDIDCSGYAIQCRITTEDPANNFKPDYGRIIAYRNAAGYGIRLDEGSSYAGVDISPFFDSLLVKVTGFGRTLKGASDRLYRALEEFRIRGVKTNIAFLENVITHPTFTNGQATVKFIEKHPELLHFVRPRDRATKTLKYLAEVAVNGNPDVAGAQAKDTFRPALIPDFDKFSKFPKGTKDKLTELGRDKFISWLTSCNHIQYTDTTFRDAHQSLIATRVRTRDMLLVAESFAKRHPQTFSMEVWGGATFDVALRFLHECPWERLRQLRQAVPNILLQMLLRGSNAVGYTAYPDNLIESFIEKSAEAGVDIFRIFDSMNWLEAMKTSIRTVRERTSSIAEVSICYTADMLDPTRTKFNLAYYLDLAKKIEDQGAHILCIKDMAGLLKPYAAEVLIGELKNSVSMPIHLHTHDTSSIQAATYLKAVEAGVHVVDVALASMSGLTSQPNFNSIVAMLKGHKREQTFDLESLNQFSNYWEAVREYYYPFESELRAGSAEVYIHEIPGGQYSNLRPQARGLGLEDRIEEIKKNYVLVNQMLGDIVKVTPASKMVGDLALFMTSNNLTPEEIMRRGAELSFPDSVKSYFRGDLGQPHGGFPKKLKELVLKGEKSFDDAPNSHLKPVDFEKEFEEFRKKFDEEQTFLDFLSYKMYPKVFEEYYKFKQEFGDVSPISTPAFFFGIQPNQELLVDIGPGKTLIIRMLNIGQRDENGMRTVFFKLNGVNRSIEVKDKSFKDTKISNRKVSKDKEKEIGAPLQGRLSKILIKSGEAVKKSTPLFYIEAMKMETMVVAPSAGTIKSVFLNEGAMVEQDDLVIELS